jgi:hypothetical protein
MCILAKFKSPSEGLPQIYRLGAGLSGLVFYPTYADGSCCCMSTSGPRTEAVSRAVRTSWFQSNGSFQAHHQAVNIFTRRPTYHALARSFADAFQAFGRLKRFS